MGELLLFQACSDGNIKVVHSLSASGLIQDYNYGLYGACCSGNLELVHLMISKGANDWKNSLQDAWNNNYLDIVAVIIEHDKPKADNKETVINEQDKTYLDKKY